MLQKLNFNYSDHQTRSLAYFKLISLMNNLELQVNDLNVLVWLSINKILSTKTKKEVCAKYNIKEGNLNNILSRLRKMGIITTQDKITTLIPVFNQDFENEMTLAIRLDVPTK